MTIKLNHTTVYVADKQASAEFMVGLFGMSEPVAWGSFLTVELAKVVGDCKTKQGGDCVVRGYSPGRFS